MVNREAERKRLVELLETAPLADITLGEYFNKPYIENCIVPHLLDNGIVVPPVKVGDMLFALWSVPTEAKYVIYSAEVVEIRIAGRNCRQTTTFLLEPLAYRGRRKEYRKDDFGKLLFTNKEDAEQALKGGEDKWNQY